MTFSPIRIFHAFLSGAVLAILLQLLLYQFQQTAYAGAGVAAFRGNGANPPMTMNQTGTAIGTSPTTTDDRDGDGIPNSWETEYQHNPDNAADAGFDFDFDGLTAKQEYDLSFRTNGAYGNPLGNFKLLPIPPPPGFKTNAAGEPLITSSGMELVESAKNGTSLFRITGIATGQASTTTRTFTYSPISESWRLVTPPAGFSNAVLYPTDINSQGQVVGSFFSGSYKGFCWTPDDSAAGGSSQQFILNTSPQASALPRRISDTGYLLYSTTPGGVLKAADPERRPIHPIRNPITTPEYVDVNDMGEFVGIIMDPTIGQDVTFLAILDGPTFLTSMTLANSHWYGESAYTGPDIDPSQINWIEVECFDLDGNPVFPGDVSTFAYGEVFDSQGDAIDPTYFSNYQYGTTMGSDALFRRWWGSDEIWWGVGSDTWEIYHWSTTPKAVLNDWGEFGGSYSATTFSQTEGNSMETFESYGSFFYDGSYNMFTEPVLGMSNDPQVLLKNFSNQFSLASDNIRCPLDKLQTSEILHPLNAKLCDNGLIVLQTQPKTFKILVPDDDSDGDGMPDDWEKNYYFDPTSYNANADPDGDGTSNYGEYLLRTDPTEAPILDANGDEIDTRPGIDTDADGIPNSWECANELNYLDPSDAKKDFDRDGYINLQEFRLNTDPRGNPAYRIREVGPFPGTSSATLSSVLLGAGEVPVTDGQASTNNITESVTLLAKPTNTSCNFIRPAKWSFDRVQNEDAFAMYEPHGVVSTSLVAFSPRGPALTMLSTTPKEFFYWNSATADPIQLSGAASQHNIKILNAPSLSPSGTYLAAMRMNQFNVWQPIVWKMPVGDETPPVPMVLPVPAVPGMTISASAILRVNDAGSVVTTATTSNGSPCSVQWKLDNSGANPTGTVLSSLVSGGWTKTIGISNTSPTIIAGESITSTGRKHAVYWSDSGAITDLGTLGGNNSTLSALSPNGHMAGISEVMVNNILLFQPFIVAPNPGNSTWTVSAQGAGSPASTIVLKSIADSGELLGTLRANTNAPAIDTLWHHGRAYPLDSVLPVSSGYVLSSVDAINSHGTLLATAWKDGYSAKILLTADIDTDGDGLPDAWENTNRFNPFSQSAPNADADSDGLTDLEEYRNATDPHSPDSDGDGMKDGWEVTWGLSPLDPADSSLDPDGDRVTNLRESKIGTVPTGKYRVEEIPLQPDETFFSGAEDGYVYTQTEYSGGNYINQLPPVPIGETRQRMGLLGGSGSWQSEIGEVYSENWATHYNFGKNGKVTGEYYFYILDEWNGPISSELALYSFDPVSSEEYWLPWSDLEATYLDADFLAEPITDQYSIGFDPVSPGGAIRVMRPPGSTRAFMLDPLGVPLGGAMAQVPTNAPQQFINDSGEMFGAWSNGWRQYAPNGSIHDYPVPADWAPYSVPTHFTNDGMAVISRNVINPDGSYCYKPYTLDTKTGTLQAMKTPGVSSGESVISVSNGGHVLGGGAKPWQIVNGCMVRLEKLRILNGSALAPINEIYTHSLEPKHVSSDGVITLTTTNSQNQPMILQITPQNDADNDGVPDDWEMDYRDQISSIFGIPNLPGNASGFDVNHDYGQTGMTAAQYFAHSQSLNPDGVIPDLFDKSSLLPSSWSSSGYMYYLDKLPVKFHSFVQGARCEGYGIYRSADAFDRSGYKKLQHISTSSSSNSTQKTTATQGTANDFLVYDLLSSYPEYKRFWNPMLSVSLTSTVTHDFDLPENALDTEIKKEVRTTNPAEVSYKPWTSTSANEVEDNPNPLEIPTTVTKTAKNDTTTTSQSSTDLSIGSGISNAYLGEWALGDLSYNLSGADATHWEMDWGGGDKESVVLSEPVAWRSLSDSAYGFAKANAKANYFAKNEYLIKGSKSDFGVTGRYQKVTWRVDGPADRDHTLMVVKTYTRLDTNGFLQTEKKYQIIPLKSKETISITEEADPGNDWESVEVRLDLLPVDITVVFGMGPCAPLIVNGSPGTSRHFLESYLDSVKIARAGNLWLVQGKNTSGIDRLYCVEVADTEEKLLSALSTEGMTVIFDGHANFGIGPNFSVGMFKKISDFTNFGVEHTDIPQEYRGSGNEPVVDLALFEPHDPPLPPPSPALNPAYENIKHEGWGLLILQQNEVMGDVQNKIVPYVKELRYKANSGIIHKKGTGFNKEWHFDTQEVVGGSPHLIVKTPGNQVPELRYSTFFYNSCSSGLHFIENFKHGNFVYTKDACNVDKGSASFVRSLVQGKTPAEATTILDDEEVDGRNDRRTYGIQSTW